MATGKKYYWIKLKKEFMTSDTVDFLMSQENGSQYVVLYQMLCLMCINTNGEMARQIGEVIIPFDIDKIERDCKFFHRDTIIVAMSLFKKLGLIYEQENGCLRISEFDNMVGNETDYAIQKRNQRSGLIVDKGVDIVHTEIRDKRLDNRDKRIDIDKEERKRTKNTSFIPPSVDEVREYCEQRNNGIDAEEFIDFYSSKGWMVGKNKMKDWQAAIRTWERSRKKKPSGNNGGCDVSVMDEWRNA